MTVRSINQRDVLTRVLLESLALEPDGMATTEAYDAIGSRYEFPLEWYREIPRTAGYESLSAAGYSNWRDVPQNRLVELVKTEPQWQNELRWARNSLRKQGLLDNASPRGLWRLTSAGMQAAGKIALAPLPPEIRKLPIVAHWSQETTRRSAEASASGTRTLREALLDKLSMLTYSMPIGDLDLVVDLARAVRVRSLQEEHENTGI